MNPTPDAASSVSTIASQMFIPTSVARMPIIRPAEPVMTPAERSNSPPIINSATAAEQAVQDADLGQSLVVDGPRWRRGLGCGGGGHQRVPPCASLATVSALDF